MNIEENVRDSKIEMFAYLSKDKDDNWTVTRQVYDMAEGFSCANDRISLEQHPIANKMIKINLDDYEPGQRVHGELLKDDTYHLNGVFIDPNNYML